jgi:hypothetical protein
MFDDCIVLDARLIEISLNSQTLLLASQNFVDLFLSLFNRAPHRSDE